MSIVNPPQQLPHILDRLAGDGGIWVEAQSCLSVRNPPTEWLHLITLFAALSGEGTMRTKSKSLTTTNLLPNPHPGEILLEEFLTPMALSQTALANAIGVPPRRINEIVLGKRAVTADTDLRLARYFGVSEGFFLGLQADYELMQRRRQIGDKLKTIRPCAA
jgi:addiction module HigA family antidote